MLIVSLALHASLATGIAVSYLHGTALPATSSSQAKAPPVLLLRSEPTPALAVQPAPPKPAITRFVTISRNAALPTSVSLVADKSPRPPTVKQAAALAVEANPNAHIEAIPPDAVLSPNPPPHLDGTNGVVFILDISGSMYEPYAGSTRLACARQTLGQRIRAMKDGTPFAIVLYAQRACASGPLVAASDATREAAVRFISATSIAAAARICRPGWKSRNSFAPGRWSSLATAT